MPTFDLNILPIERINGQESTDVPGVFAVTPPRKAARGREKDNLVIYLKLSGNATVSTGELAQINSSSANTFYQSPGSLTSAMRKVAENINTSLLERNLSTTGRGQYALGLLVLAAVRDAQCTLLLAGPTHAVWVGENQSRHIHDPALSGKGLGASQSIQSYFSQIELHQNDLLLMCGTFPTDWEADLMGEHPPASLESSYRKLTFTKGDLNAALIQAQSGSGIITLLRTEPGALPRSPLEPDSVPQTDPSSGLIDSPEGVEDVLIESPQSFRDEPRNEQPSSANYRDATPRDQDRGLDTGFATDAQPHSTTDNDQSTISTIDSPVSSITEEELDHLVDFAAHMVQPSAYAIPPQPEELIPLPNEEKPPFIANTPRSFPPSIPRIQPAIQDEPAEPYVVEETEIDQADELVSVTAFSNPRPDEPNAHAMATRQMAKVMVGGIQTARRVSDGVRSFLKRFIPRLLPGAENPEGKPRQQQPFIVPTYAMVFMAIVIPVLVVTVASVMYLRFGQSVQYDELYSQALNARAQAVSETDPARQRDAWQSVVNFIEKAEDYRETDESILLRSEAQTNLDNLMGIVRLEFVPAFTSGLGNSTQISRMAASESDLYMLDAERGNILHAMFTGRSLELDGAFNCQPGTHAGYQVGTLVDLLALPKVNAAGASVLGIDANGNLLYCSPGQVPQALPLPSLPNTNWTRITSFVLDGRNLYVLDATSRAVWVFVGKDGTFVDAPYFYFGNQIPSTIDSAIDLAVSGDDLYLLHADGHVSTCTFSRIAETPTRCIDPIIFQDDSPAHQGINVFAQAHFTQMSLTNPPNSVVLLLDSDNQSVFRFSPRSLELQNQVSGYAGKANPFQSGPVGAMTVSPNYVLYLAIGDQVYFATNLP